MIRKTILYDKFLSIEGWALRGKTLIERDRLEKAMEAVERIEKDLEELRVLLKMPVKD
jgi:hypothetical protein